jgi:(E)-4-hydroxy-3-methylbut-2-enyl-diphosphate synthase
VVVADLSGEPEITQPLVESLGFKFNSKSPTPEKTGLAPDIIYTGEHFFPFSMPPNVQVIIDHNYWDERSNAHPLFSWEEYKIAEKRSREQNWVQIELKNLNSDAIELIKNDDTLVLINFSYHKNQTAEQRAFANALLLNEINCPLIALRSYKEINTADFQLKSATDTGILFIDGLYDGLWLKNTFNTSHQAIIETCYGILQATRSRISKTEYISCPSCGRTLFDLEKAVKEVKEATAHLKGLKIAVMGCIVNGPGEMADADYGYVGAGAGKVSLYKGKQVIKKNMDASLAVKELLKIIEQDNL